MNATHLVELLDRSGRTQAQFLLGDTPISIGRAPGNQIVLDDPYVCAAHAEILPGEVATLRDKGSVNGSYIGRAKVRVHTAELQDNALIRLGHSRLRVRRNDAAVSPTERDPLLTSALFRLDQPLVGGLALVLMIVVLTIISVLGSSDSEPWLGALSKVTMAAVGLVLVWVGLMSLLNRLLADRARLSGHLAIASIALTLSELISIPIDLFAFALNLDGAHQWLTSATGIALGLGTIYAHSRLISSAPSRKLAQRLFAVALVPLVIFGVALLAADQDEEFDASPDLSLLIGDPRVSLTRGESSAEWLENAQELVLDLNEADQKKP